jgi:3-deoxy-D-manno-octulosonic-acid transferase
MQARRRPRSARSRAERAGLAAALVLAPGTASAPWRWSGSCAAGRRCGGAWPGREPLRAGEVLLLDTLGELPALWPHADVSFVGGTLVAVGGHNVLEPVGAGRPVLFGPHTGKIRHAVEIVVAAGAAVPLRDEAALGPALCALLRDPAAARECGERGRQALLAHQGSAARSAALVATLLRPEA